jgi:hypothetical protein
MPISIEIKGQLRFKIKDNIEIFYIDNSEIERNFEWREYSPPSFKEDSSDAESQYSINMDKGTIRWSVHTSSSMDSISIISTEIIEIPTDIEVLNDIYFDLKEESNWE